ncbi:MAG: hypothetical protein ACRDJ1_11720 [Actinomycetota bacterium]
MRRRLTSVSLAFAVLAIVVPGQWSTASGARKALPRNDYTRYLLDHDKLPHKALARKIMSNPAQIPASLIETKQQKRVAAAAVDPCESTDRPLGCEDSFFVSLPAGGTREIPVVLAAKGPHSYIWVFQPSYDPTDATGSAHVADTGGTVTATEAQTAADRFEKIWEIDRAYFGHEANPLEKPFRLPPRLPSNWRDADGDVHINIVNYPMDAGATYTAGYFSPSDEYPAEVNPQSNEGEFFYMNSVMLTVGGDTYAGVLAHEFYHMIQFANDSNEESWINEGMADIAIEVNEIPGLVEGHQSEFFNTPEGDQLNTWGGQIIDYGIAYSYLTYFLEHYGGPDDPKTHFKENYTIAKDITNVAADGFEGLDVVLKKNPRKSLIDPYYRDKTADDVYLDWTIANYLDDTSIGAGQYGYANQDLTVQPMESFTEYPAAVADQTITPYTNRYYDFVSAGDGKVALNVDRQVQIVNNLEGIPSGTHEYWSNRGDDMATSMTRAADLRGTSNPALTFSYWYDLETDWDYVYLEVSEDAGKSWTPLVCCEARGTDPNGNNQAASQAAGITGQSGVEEVIEQITYQGDNNAAGEPLGLRGPLGGDPAWVEETVDLATYAGKQVLIRFRYQTDAAVNFPGFTVDDVALADGSRSIWALDDAESENPAWKLEGDTALTFKRIVPLIRNNLTPQLIKFGGATIVDRPSVTTKGEVTTGAGPMDATHAVLVVSSLTRVTSEVFGYGVDANASPLSGLTAPVLDALPKEISLPFTLKWKPASKAGTLSPRQYVVEEIRLLGSQFTDDAEAGLERWDLSGTTTAPLSWETSGEVVHSGASSFFARAIEGLPNQQAIMTTKEKVKVPSMGTAVLNFWSYFMNEGDSGGYVEVSTDGETWRAIKTVRRDAFVLDALAEALGERTMVEESASLDDFRGREILIRFRLSENDIPILSVNDVGLYGTNWVDEVPFGWYVDDVVLRAGELHEVGTTAGNATSFTLPKGSSVGGNTSYRVVARYTGTLQGPFSNAAQTKVTGGAGRASVGGTKTTNQKPLPATGVGSSGLAGFALLGTAGALAAWSRRRTVHI